MLRNWILACILALSLKAAPYSDPVENDWIVPQFAFASGEHLDLLRVHYTTLGRIERGKNGRVSNAVLILHGTGGSGKAFLSANFGDQLFGPGQLLDTSKYFVILPDAIGSGGSSKPSEGLHQRFPHYTYTDLVNTQYRLVTEKLGIDHLRLVMGTSMGAMHTWMWGYMHPDFMDALMPLASAPVEIGGRNRMLRKMIIDSLTTDPEFKGGEYKGPLKGMLGAQFALFVMTTSPLQLYQSAPTRDQADAMFQTRFVTKAPATDPNDMIYYFDASRDYNPQPYLEKIVAPLFAINSADDQVNPPELGILEREIVRVKRGRYILIPTGPETRGHGTHSLPKIWGGYLKELLDASSAER